MQTIFDQVMEHYRESLNFFHQNQIVGCFLQGSQNYNLSTPESDVDTKLIVVPSFKDIALNRKLVSTTHVRANNEHTDFKDIRLYMDTFRKQNLNFIEILFTPYFVINLDYQQQWTRLVENKESITRMNPIRAIRSMSGMAETKFKNMTHWVESKKEVFEEFGYAPKELCHLLRIYDFLHMHEQGYSYKGCIWYDKYAERRYFLMSIKKGVYSKDEAIKLANEIINDVRLVADKYKGMKETEDPAMRELLEDVQYEIMKIAIREELNN